MKREEEIKQASAKYIGHSQDLGEDIAITNMRNAFIRGAKWADENPNQNGKELLYVAQKTTGRTKKEFIEKTKKWMKEQCYQEFPGAPLERLISDELIEDYIKTMEERL